MDLDVSVVAGLAETSRFEHYKRYGFYYLLVPFQRDPLTVSISISKTRVVPRYISVSLAPIES